MDNETIILLECLKMSPNKVKVLKAFNGEILRPNQITKITQLHKNTVSKTLTQLKEMDLVYLLNPEHKVPRLYKLTAKGEEIVELIYKE